MSLENEGLPLCRNESCSMNLLRKTQCSESFRNPPAHFHLDFLGADFIENADTVHLYRMEDVLWELPILGRGVDFTDGPRNNVIFANDASLSVGSELQGWGRFPESSPGTRIPTLHRYIEALILLMLSSERNSFSRNAWLSELTYVADLVNLDRLGHPAFKQFVTGLITMDNPLRVTVAEALESLHLRLHRSPMSG